MKTFILVEIVNHAGLTFLIVSVFSMHHLERYLSKSPDFIHLLLDLNLSNYGITLRIVARWWMYPQSLLEFKKNFSEELIILKVLLSVRGKTIFDFKTFQTSISRFKIASRLIYFGSRWTGQHKCRFYGGRRNIIQNSFIQIEDKLLDDRWIKD